MHRKFPFIIKKQTRFACLTDIKNRFYPGRQAHTSLDVYSDEIIFKTISCLQLCIPVARLIHLSMYTRTRLFLILPFEFDFLRCLFTENVTILFYNMLSCIILYIIIITHLKDKYIFISN